MMFYGDKYYFLDVIVFLKLVYTPRWRISVFPRVKMNVWFHFQSYGINSTWREYQLHFHTRVMFFANFRRKNNHRFYYVSDIYVNSINNTTCRTTWRTLVCVRVSHKYRAYIIIMMRVFSSKYYRKFRRSFMFGLWCKWVSREGRTGATWSAPYKVKV